MKPIIEVKNVSKQYRIGKSQRYLSLRDSIADWFKFGKKAENDTFWALDDVSFDVYPGESIGIIGRNGAGKSTLLKILSKITPPTKGEVILRGRLASLLEVGTGFHPELTGRENIYMNGSILGLRKAEINRKFDAIVDFSGVEKFIDTPLKHYSSGMQLRLAFSVAAHLEPEILVIDEVLAVGDAEFQKKCLGKMDEVSKSGRTVVFVSHDLNLQRNLCQKGILLEQGKLNLWDDIQSVTLYYENNVKSSASSSKLPLKIDDNVSLEHLSITNVAQETVINIKLSYQQMPKFYDFCLVINSFSGIRVAVIDLRNKLSTLQFDAFKANWTIKIPRIRLVEGLYPVGVYFTTANNNIPTYDVITFNVEETVSTNEYAPYPSKHRGFLEIDV